MTASLRRRVAPSVPLSLELREDGGQTLRLDFSLSFDFNALALVEETTGFSVLAGDIWNELSARTLSTLFWASLLAHHPEYEGKEGLAIVRSYMDASNAAAITEAVTQAFIISLPADRQASMREARLNPIPPTPVAPEPAGSNSGPSPVMTSASTSPNSAD